MSKTCPLCNNKHNEEYPYCSRCNSLICNINKKRKLNVNQLHNKLLAHQKEIDLILTIANTNETTPVKIIREHNLLKRMS